MHLSDIVKTIRVLAPQAAGTTDVNTDVVPVADGEGVRFLVGFGAITAGAVTLVKGQQGLQSDGSDMADLAGTKIDVLDTDDNKLVILDIMRPEEPFVRAVIDRGTQNAVVDLVIAEVYRRRTIPVTKDATVAQQETHVTPAEGTA